MSHKTSGISVTGSSRSDVIGGFVNVDLMASPLVGVDFRMGSYTPTIRSSTLSIALGLMGQAWRETNAGLKLLRRAFGEKCLIPKITTGFFVDADFRMDLHAPTIQSSTLSKALGLMAGPWLTRHTDSKLLGKVVGDIWLIPNIITGFFVDVNFGMDLYSPTIQSSTLSIALGLMGRAWRETNV